MSDTELLADAMNKYAVAHAEIERLKTENEKLIRQINEYSRICDKFKTETEKLMRCYQAINSIVHETSYVGMYD